MYGCELIMGMYIRMSIYVYLHIGTETYLPGIKRRWSNKSGL